MTFPGIRQVLRLNVTDSTQAVARYLAEQGAPDRTLVWADLQTSGRGRLERAWESRPGGLYCSLILRPDFSPSRLADFSLLCARAAAEALHRHAAVETSVKPPNDVYGRRAGKSGKLCGILAEASGGARSIDWLALGVGINVNNPVRGIRGAASLKSLSGRSWEVEDVLRGFLGTLLAAYEKFS